MNFVTCRYCGATYVAHNHTTVCDNCKKRAEHDFDIIQTYLSVHPNSNALEVSASTSLTIPHIMGFVDDGRLILVINKKQINNTQDNQHTASVVIK